MRNVSRSQSWKETPGLSVAPSGMCPRRSGKHLHLGTLTALGNNSAFACFFGFWFFLTAYHAHMHRYKHSHSSLLTVQTKKARCYYFNTNEFKSDGAKSGINGVLLKKIDHCLCFPFYLLHSLNYGLLKCRKVFTCRLEGKMAFNTKVR